MRLGVGDGPELGVRLGVDDGPTLGRRLGTELGAADGCWDGASTTHFGTVKVAVKVLEGGSVLMSNVGSLNEGSNRRKTDPSQSPS